jgi:hypothetical protein
MSTKNHKAATTSDILSDTPSTLDPQHPVTPPSTPDPRHSFSALRARCGKVARLPKEIRDQLNEMLLDGVPHSQIIQKLHAQFGSQSNALPLTSTDADAQSVGLFPLPVRRGEGQGEGSLERDGLNSSSVTNPPPENQSLITNHQSLLATLTPRHITNWKKFGGYRDWLQHQHRLEECKLRHELTLDLARSAEGLASYQAAPKVAVAQICQTIIDLGPDGLKDAMQASPLNCFRLLNALARLINSGLKCEQHIQKAAVATDKERRNPMDRSRFARIERNLNLL